MSAGTLTAAEGRVLLRRAREAIRAQLTGEAPDPWGGQPAALSEDAGAFVSLHTRNGELRGCVGYLEARYPLVEAVERAAVLAATEDHRFAPVTLRELEGLVLEVSVLGASFPIRPEAVEVGRHGLAVERGRQRGLLLPQVAVDQGWDRETFLDHTCMKAGLPRGAWREAGTTLRAFEAAVFAEAPTD